PHQRRQEAVQPIEIGEREKDIAAEGLEAAARIARAVVEDAATHGIGDPRLQLLETRILAAAPLAGCEPGFRPAGVERRDELRNEGRIVLAVTIERGDDGGASGAHAAAHRGTLA